MRSCLTLVRSLQILSIGSIVAAATAATTYINRCPKSNVTIESLPPATGTIIWEDDFTGGQLNDERWNYDIGDGCDTGMCGWGNWEHQNYTRDSVQTGVDESLLRITARRTGEHSWTSGRINTRGKFSFTYGRMDARVRLPTMDGAFSAVWLAPLDNAYGAWPNSGEIDLVEYQSAWRTRFQPEQVRTPGTVHSANHYNMDAASFWAEGNDPSQWHTYSLVWHPDSIEFLLDDQFLGQYTPSSMEKNEWPFDRPFYLIINLAIEPYWATTVPSDINEITMDVDWVRFTQL
ncbi:concanavalin A-like lectin/glucanase domain-containing protein [Syncephalis plumigaleata]|nr:concanavalin A-like lectin/glucanase domain-containing protein [Syncephalis plumigaleata]